MREPELLKEAGDFAALLAVLVADTVRLRLCADKAVVIAAGVEQAG